MPRPSPTNPAADPFLEATTLLRAGRLVVLPTDTHYGVAARATSPEAIAALRSLLSPDAPTAFTWHAADVASVLEAIAPVQPLERHAIEHLAPGPVRFLFPRTAPDAICQHLGLLPGLIVHPGPEGPEIAVRIPDHVRLREVLRGVNDPVVMVSTSRVGLGDGTQITPEDVTRAGALNIACANDGPTRHTRPSTSIRVGSHGVTVTAPGAMSEEAIRRRIERLVLFVCTGNTCRSPMAEAIAINELASGPPGGIPVRVQSAGVAAGPGAPMTNEAAQALEAMGVDPGRHRSQSLSPDLIERAEVIYTMTRAHAHAVLRLDPAAAPRVEPLDPTGEDVPDPIGQGFEVYRSTARRLRDLVRLRLAALADPHARKD